MYMYPLRLKIFLFLLFIICIVCGCIQKEERSKFRLHFRGDNYYEEQIVEVDDLSGGAINPKETGIVLDKDVLYNFYYHKRAYYNIELPHKIKKYILCDDVPTLQDSCAIKGMTEIETHTFVDDTTLLVIGLDMEHRNPVYAIINTKDLKIIREGDVAIPDDGSYQRTSVGFAALIGKILYVNYVYHYWNGNSYTTPSSVSLVSLDFPSMTPLHYSNNNKSTYPPKNGRHQPTMAADGKDAIFFITNTSIGFGYMDSIPSGIMKVDVKKKNLDANFFINISDVIPNRHPVAIWFVSGDIFLIKCENQHLINSWSDYLNERIIEYYSVNVATGALRKLDVPLDTPWYSNNVIVDNDIAYIANNAENGYTFWVFDPKNNSLKEGLKVDSSVKRIFSVDFN